MKDGESEKRDGGEEKDTVEGERRGRTERGRRDGVNWGYVPEHRVERFLRFQPRALMLDGERFKMIVTEVLQMGFESVKSHFLRAVNAVVGLSKETRERKLDLYRKWGWTDDEILSAFRKQPAVLVAFEYSRVLMRKHRARQAAETNLLRCKKEAIEVLPEELKSAALVPVLALFPMNRFMATLTPPIEGYTDKINEAAKRKVGKDKLR